MRVYFTTIVRGAPNRNAGELVCVDWERKTVLHRQDLPFDNPYIEDPNPRGNTRGGRGIVQLGNEIIAGTYHSLKYFTPDLKLQRTFSHPLMASLHEMHDHQEGKLWVTSTAIDLALEFEIPSGHLLRTVSPRDQPGLQRALSLEPLGLDLSEDHRTRHVETASDRDKSHLHLNAVCTWKNELFALFHSKGAIANLDRDEVVIQDEDLQRNHNLHICPDGIGFTNNTYGPAVLIWDFNSRKIVDRIELKKFAWIKAMAKRPTLIHSLNRGLKRVGISRKSLARPLFLRGMYCHNDLLFVGLSPASIVCLNWKTRELVDAFQYTTDLRHSIHGIKVVA